MPLVSIIMPVYNGERFVSVAIESVLGQTMTDWELIVIDDGSTDQTPFRIRCYNDARIRYVSQQNAGRSTARNHGLDLARGEYVLFLDADDTLLPECLEIHLAYVTSHPRCDGSISDCELVDESGNTIVHQSTLRQRFVPNYGILPRDGVEIFDPLVVSAPLIGAPHTVMVRLETINRGHSRFDPEMFMGEDWDFWLQVAETAIFGFVEVVTCRYLWHGQNTVATHNWTTRRQSLLRGRNRVMSSSRFDLLADETKSLFFHQMLFELLADQPNEQRRLLISQPFGRLPVAVRARLLRQTGIESMLRAQPSEFTAWCLQLAASTTKWPSVEHLVWLLWRTFPFLLRSLTHHRRSAAQQRNENVYDPEILAFLQALDTN